jgi:hypothetical protein
MATKSKNPKIAIKNPDMRAFIAGQIMVPQLTDSGSGIAAGRICELTSGEIKLGTEQNALVMGITRNAIAIDAKGDVEFGFVPAMAGSPVNAGDRIASRASGYIGKAQTGQVSLLDAEAGASFAVQPSNDGVEIVSSSASDTTQTVTLYGIRNGAATTLVTEVLTLTGTTQVVSSYTDWTYILGIRLSAVTVGNITVREASGNVTIKAITAGDLTGGISAAKTTQAYGLIPRHDQSDAGTAPVCVVGTGLDGVAINIIDTMNGTTEEDHGTTPFATVTEFYTGAVDSGVNINFLTNEASDASAYCGVALQTTTVAGVPIDCWIKPYWM